MMGFKQTVFFIVDSYCRGGSMPHTEYSMKGSFEALGGSAVVYHYDRRDWAVDLARSVEQVKPDLVVATVQMYFDRNVPPDFYGYVCDELRIPVVMIWYESAPDAVRWADMYAPHTTATVFTDTTEYWKQFTQYPEKCCQLLEPRDPRVFRFSDARRSVAVGMIGTVLRLDRAFNVAWCWANDLPVRVFGIDGRLPIDEYVRCIQSCQVALSFTSGVTFQQIKGMLMEAPLCGTLLMESESTETQRWFEPYVHYVPFKEPFHIDEMTGSLQFYFPEGSGDLVEKARYYTGLGQVKARQIVECGYKRALELFDGRKFWKEMFELAGLKC